MRRFAIYLVPLIMMLGVALSAEILSRRYLNDERLALHVVDIQQPEQLLVKLDYLRRFDGVKIVLLGDSLIYGRTMENHGDAQWRIHELSAVLQRKLRQAAPDKNILVINLGINGALPADMESLAELIVPIGVDIVVFDTHLRPFSGDFELPGQRFCRPWLANISVDNRGRLTLIGEERNWVQRSSDLAIATLTNYWDPYRKRQFLQEQITSGEAFAWGRRLRDQQSAKAKMATEAQDSPEILLLKLKGRLKTVSLNSDRFQRRAMQKLLDYLSRQKQKTIVFYAAEQPALLRRTISPETYAQKRTQLEEMILAVPGILYRGRVESLTTDDYLDYSHLNAAGYEKLADALVDDMRRLAPDIIK